MKNTFSKQLKILSKYAYLFNEFSASQKIDALIQLSKIKLPGNKLLLDYFEVLLFTCSHPQDKKILSLAERELSRISKFMRQNRKVNHQQFENSGLPFSKTFGGYSHDLIRWMITNPNCRTEISHFGGSGLELNEVLKITLPSVEREQTSAGMNNEELMDVLKVKKRKRLSFILNELAKLDRFPLIKDHLLDTLNLNVCITPTNKIFSTAYNRIDCKSIFFSSEKLKVFDHLTLLNKKVQSPEVLNSRQKENLSATIKNSLALTIRETDTSTYKDLNSLQLYRLERGIAIAIYGIVPERQLPLESYVGYTLFKNGFPVAYGGGWVFGKRALFGINIFEPFRGGESGYMMCQLLRIYRQVFKVSYFEVEPYQYGEDNPDGITSGAFWFYYRYGFRPLDKKLHRLSKKESNKFKLNKNYRSARNTLLQFTKSSIALNLESGTPPTVGSFTRRITKMIEKNYSGNRTLAVAECKEKLSRKLGIKLNELNPQQETVLEETALLSSVIQSQSKKMNDFFLKMIFEKPTDLYSYQENLLTFFRKLKK